MKVVHHAALDRVPAGVDALSAVRSSRSVRLVAPQDVRSACDNWNPDVRPRKKTFLVGFRVGRSAKVGSVCAISLMVSSRMVRVVSPRKSIFNSDFQGRHLEGPSRFHPCWSCAAARVQRHRRNDDARRVGGGMANEPFSCVAICSNSPICEIDSRTPLSTPAAIAFSN